MINVSKKKETETEAIYWDRVRLEGNDFMMAATERGLGYLQFQERNAADGVDEETWLQFSKWVNKIGPQTSLIQDREALKPYIQQLDEYMKGERTAFALPLDLQGTTFQQAVWKALHDISHGATMSYSQVAQSLGKSNAVRAVGTAIGVNPVLIVVPCHRVVGKDGALTGYRGGLANKERLLVLERNR